MAEISKALLTRLRLERQRFIKKDDKDRLILGIGKHAGTFLDDVAEENPDYIRWMLREIDDMPEVVRHILEISIGDDPGTTISKAEAHRKREKKSLAQRAKEEGKKAPPEIQDLAEEQAKDDKSNGGNYRRIIEERQKQGW